MFPYYTPLINWRWKKARLTAYFTVNLSVLSCVSHNLIFGTQLSSSSTPSCMCIWFILLLSFQMKPAFCLCYSISPINTSIISFLDSMKADFSSGQLNFSSYTFQNSAFLRFWSMNFLQYILSPLLYNYFHCHLVLKSLLSFFHLFLLVGG